ncbi:MAG: hypothetical protein ACSLEM_04470 [Candidatus Malihini olakiniferum]
MFKLKDGCFYRIRNGISGRKSRTLLFLLPGIIASSLSTRGRLCYPFIDALTRCA